MKLHTKIAIGLALGAACGLLANTFAPGSPTVRWIADNVANPVGQIFLRMLLMTVVPLVFASITLAAGSFRDMGSLGRVGGRTILLFLVSTTISATIGLTLVNVIQPGGSMPPEIQAQLMAEFSGEAEGLVSAEREPFGINTFVNIVPRNVVSAAADGQMLSVIFFAIAFGAALTLIPQKKAQPVLDFLDGVNEVVLRLIGFAMSLAPYGVFGLIFTATSRFGWDLMRDLLMYVVVVVVGLLIHAIVGLGSFVRFLAGMSPVEFFKRIDEVIITAFSTSSSSATLPTSISTAERDLGVPSEIAGFVLPLGATMNMNGTALYEGVTVLFLAQVFGAELTLLQQVIVVIMAVLTAVGTAGVPGGSLPLIMLVLATVGVPPESIALILGVDRILDMCRTTLNVTGDLAVTLAVARAEGRWDPKYLPAENY